MKNKAAIIGLGNPLRRDDGIGLLILEELKKLYEKSNIDFFDYGTCSIDLINVLKNYKMVLIIDAINVGAIHAYPPRRELPQQSQLLSIFKLKDISYYMKENPISTHEINLSGLFELIKTFNIKTKIYIAGIHAKDTSFGEGLSKKLLEGKAEIISNICRFISLKFAK